MVPRPEGRGASTQPLGARCSQSFRVLPLLSHPPYSPGWAEGENRAALQGMARKQDASFPQWRGRGGHAMSSNLARGQRNRHQCAGQALGPYREALPGQSTA